jgi:hypothetical protein
VLDKVPNKRVAALVKGFLPAGEDAHTARLIRRLGRARRRGYLTRSELEAVCAWKSARAIHHIKANSPSRIRTATRRALATRDETRRLKELMALSGVGVPMASSILMLIDPRRYGVIDIRVWQILHAAGAVTRKPAGVGFSAGDWCQFLAILRSMAAEFRVKARDIERALFSAHEEYQQGRLYGDRRPIIT